MAVLDFDSRRGLGIFLHTTVSRLALEPTQPPIQWVPGALSMEVKLPGREADHSPPSSAEVKECAQLHLHSPNKPSWRGAQSKYRDNFTFTIDLLCVFTVVVNWEFLTACFTFKIMWRIPIKFGIGGLIWKLSGEFRIICRYPLSPTFYMKPVSEVNIAVFLIVTSCSNVVWYLRIGTSCCFHRYHNPEGHDMNLHRRENIKSRITVWFIAMLKIGSSCKSANILQHGVPIQMFQNITILQKSVFLVL
jgi:hypothetical protein